MAPVLRPNDPPFGAPRGGGPPAPPGPPGLGGAPPMGGSPGPMGAAPGGAPAGPAGPPTMDPAEMQRQALIGLLEQATPVPGTVRQIPDGYDTMPKPYFPANSENRTRRSGQGY